MHRILCIFLFLTVAHMVMAQDKPAYQLFDSTGQQVTYGQMLDSLATARVVFFGEIHNNPITHWLQREVAHDLHEQTEGRLVIGAEMFETDDQLLLNEYLQGLISTRNFEQEARLWDNYPTDYKPLVEFAAESGLPVVATNIPRRYANLVFREGLQSLDSLSDDAKAYLPELPIAFDPELPGYRAMLEMMPGHGDGGNLNLPMAQAAKDATMAHFILQNLPAEGVLLHVNGAYHSENFEGIIWYVRQAEPELPLQTITTVEQADVQTLEAEHRGKAHFILAVPDTMTKTF